MAVVLLVGIPGSGKTTLTHALSAKSSNAHIITFDEALPSDVWDETTFQSSRNTNLERVTEYINRIARNCENDCDTLPEVVVVDDLMYLRSMRREIYVLGRDRNVPILVVWVKTDIEVALERNSRREGRLCIAESTVRKIAEHLQPPDPALIFDRNSITIDGNGPVDMLERHAAAILEATKGLCAKNQEERRSASAQATLRISGDAPVEEQSAPSILKRLDGKLRETTATALKLAGEYLPAQRRALGSLFATAKAAVLAQARNDSDCISCDAEKHWMEPYQRQLLEKVRGEVTTAAADQGEVGTAEQDRYFHAVRGAIGIEPTDS